MLPDLNHRSRNVRDNARKALLALEDLRDECEHDRNVHPQLELCVDNLANQQALLKALGPTRTNSGHVKLLENTLRQLDQNIKRAKEDLKPESRYLCCVLPCRFGRQPNEASATSIELVNNSVEHLRQILKDAAPLVDNGPDNGDRIYTDRWKLNFRRLEKLETLQACRFLQHDLPKADWAGSSAEEQSPRDGKIYSQEKLKKMDQLVSWFHRTWEEHAATQSGGDECPARETIHHIASICLVLQTIDCGYPTIHLPRFCEYYLQNKCDLTLPLEEVTLSKILTDRDEVIQAFRAGQYRVVRRSHISEWQTNKMPVKLLSEEPLPYEPGEHMKPGSHATVQLWRHVDDNKCYAIKKARNSNHYDKIRREAQILSSMDLHDHVIKLECVLERSGSLMLMLSPAGLDDLQGFLETFRKDSRNSTYDQRLLKPREKILLNAFGCLSHGLRHIHNSIRHRDVKLDNIIYVKNDRGEARLVIADFGIAHHFGAENQSGTENSWQFAAMRCAAPEVLQSCPHYRSSGSEELRNYFTTKCKDNPKGLTEEQTKSHDTKADVFSLGACFMDILAALVGDDLPNPRHPSETNFIFAENVDAVQEWAQRYEESGQFPELNAAFHVARNMLSFFKADRWDMNAVINHLVQPTRIRDLMFCGQLCLLQAQKLATEPATPTPDDATSGQRTPIPVQGAADVEGHDEGIQTSAVAPSENPAPSRTVANPVTYDGAHPHPWPRLHFAFFQTSQHEVTMSRSLSEKVQFPRREEGQQGASIFRSLGRPVRSWDR